MSNRNQRRQAKYNAMIQAGLPADLARQARDWSWERINREIANLRPEDLEFVKRRFEDLPSRERYKRSYHLLRSAGFTSKEAKRLQTRPIEEIQFIVTTRQQRRPDQVKGGWDYQGLDKRYRHDFAYRVHFDIRHEGTDEIERKIWTVVKDRPMTREEVEATIEELYFEAEAYGTEFVGIVHITPMKAGLGGVR